MAERYLSVAQVAERLGITERFPRRLIAERRITFVKVGVTSPRRTACSRRSCRLADAMGPR